jgi:SAM-dependent methyltransferase
VDPQYVAHYADLYRRHWWWQARERFLTETLRRAAPAEGWARALDVGCGDGLFLGVLRDFATHVEGIEINAAAVSRDTRRSYRVHIGQLDSAFQPGSTFDVITMLDVLEHMRDPLGALRRSRELLSPDGVLIVTVPAFESLWTRHDERNRHFTRFRRSSLTDLLVSAGFGIRLGGYFYHWLVPVKLGARLIERFSGVEFRVTRPPGRLTNRICYAISRVESLAISPSRWLPGSSLLLLAEHARDGVRLNAGTAGVP